MENQLVAEKYGATEILVELVRSSSKKSEDLKHYASIALVNITQHRGKFLKY